jgi:hypothetical protein
MRDSPKLFQPGEFLQMNSAIEHFIEAHEYCRTLERLLLCIAGGIEYAALSQELRLAYEDLDRRTLAITGIRFAESNTLLRSN